MLRAHALFRGPWLVFAALALAVAAVGVSLWSILGTTDCGTFAANDGRTFRISGPPGSSCSVPAGRYVTPDGRAFTVSPR